MNENERCELQNEHIKDIAELQSDVKYLKNEVIILTGIKGVIESTLTKLTTLFEVQIQENKKRDEDDKKRDERQEKESNRNNDLFAKLTNSIMSMNNNVVMTNKTVDMKIDSLTIKVDSIEKKVDEKIEKIDDEIDAVKEKDKTWQGTLISKFNIGKKFSTFLKVTTGIILGGFGISLLISLGLIIANFETIMNWFLK